MAVWDTVSAGCPSCGDSLTYDEALHASICRSCGNVYEAGTLNFTGKFRFVDVDNASEQEENKREYVCGSCGATLVTNENTAATFCAFCGSPSLVARRLSREFRPDLIIPFSIKEDEAKKILNDWILKNPNVPNKFRSANTINRIRGLYVPFWLLNADCYSKIEGLGFASDMDETRAVFKIKREVMFKVKNVPFDGCLDISNFLMGAIEPFNYDEMVKYDDTYLPGYYAYRYDKNALDMTDIIDIRLSGYAKQAGETIAKTKNLGDNHSYTDVITDSSESYIKNLSQSYALLPVWFLNVKYQDEDYTIAINGQTGRIAGSLPVSKAKMRWRYASVFALPVATLMAVAALLIVLGIYVLKMNIGLIFAMCTVFSTIAILGTAGIVMWCKKKAKKLDKEMEEVNVGNKPNSDVSTYFDYSTTPEIVKSEDEYIGLQHRRLQHVNGEGADNYEWDWF